MNQESASHVGYRWYVALLLMGIYTCQTLDRTVLNTLFEPIRHEFGLTDNQLGMLAGIAYAIPYAVTAIPFGMLADRMSRKRLLAFVTASWSVLTAFSGLAGSYWALLAARTGVGTMEAGCPPNTASLTADYFPPRQRSAATATFMAGASLGMLGGFAIGGIVATAYGWRTAFFVAGAPGILLALLVLTTVKEPPRAKVGEMLSSAPSLRATLNFIKGQKALVQLIGALILLHASQTATSVWITSYLVRFHDMPLRDAGIAIAIGLGGCGFLGTAAGGLIADRMGKVSPEWRVKVPIVTLLVATMLWSGVLLATERSTAIALLWLWAFFNVGWLGAVYGLIVSLVVPRMCGTTMSLAILLGNGIGASAGPQLVGYLSDQMSGFAGSESLRYALFAPIFINLWAIWHCFIASRFAAADLQRIEQSAP